MDKPFNIRVVSAEWMPEGHIMVVGNVECEGLIPTTEEIKKAIDGKHITLTVNLEDTVG